jgi:hypothetical protein
MPSNVTINLNLIKQYLGASTGFPVMVKIKHTLEQAMKAQSGSTGIALLCL